MTDRLLKAIETIACHITMLNDTHEKLSSLRPQLAEKLEKAADELDYENDVYVTRTDIAAQIQIVDCLLNLTSVKEAA